MKKQNVIVPKGIRYLSDWSNFRFINFPAKCILDKVIPGCGFTEYCLTGPENVILCSPRKILLENKKEKHGDEVYLVRNEREVTLNYDKNLSNKPDKSALIVQNPEKDDSKKIYERIYNELTDYSSVRFNQGNLPLKILVTYDSFHVVKDILEHLGAFKNFFIIVDEFQTILHDSKFKSDTELEFLEVLQGSHSAMFVSATPMMEEYLNELDEFNTLPYFVLDWVTEEPSRITKPFIKPLTMKSVNTKCREIITKYKSGKFESVKVVDKNGETKEVVSTEAVFYVNSVNHIINVINTCDLKPEEVNILCSDTDYNRRRLKGRLKIKEHKIGRVPMENEPNKMFTFCTRTVYLGADFYSKCARSFIFSDANINTLVVDISEDLAQIMGRQRDEENPWARTAVFYYTSFKGSQEDLEKNLEKKFSATNYLLRAFDSVDDINAKQELSRKYEKAAKAFNYQDDYVAVNSNGQPVLNKLAMISEKRAYAIQKYDYADRASIFNQLEEKFGEGYVEKFDELKEISEKYKGLTTNVERLKLLCSVSPDLMYKFVNTYLPASDQVRFIMLALPQKRLIALRFNITDINKEITENQLLKDLSGDILIEFKEGDHYSSVDLAKKLKELYGKHNINRKAKATDIKRWFEVKDLKLQDKTLGKRVRGIKLIKRL